MSELDPVPGVAERLAHHFRVRILTPENDWTTGLLRAIASRQRRKHRLTGRVTPRLANVLKARLRLQYLQNPSRYRNVVRGLRNARVLADFEIVEP